MKDFLKKNLAYVVGCISILAIIGFLFAPLLDYTIKVDGVKTTTSLNIIGLFNPNVCKTWLPVTILVFISAIIICFVFAFAFKNNKKVHDGFTTALLIAIFALFVISFLSKSIFDYFAGEAETPLIENFRSSSISWGLGVIIFFSTITFLCGISFSSFSKQSTKAIAEDGILIAAAFVLNFIKIPIQSGGGSINFQMFPLLVIALRRGPLTGLICSGVIYGALTCLTDGYGFASYPFDYLIGFGSTAAVGFFNPLIFPKEEKPLWQRELWLFLGGVLVTLIRFIGSTTSSMVIYDTGFVASLIYNSVYIPVSCALAVAVTMLLLPSITAINRRYPTSTNETGQ